MTVVTVSSGAAVVATAGAVSMGANTMENTVNATIKARATGTKVNMTGVMKQTVINTAIDTASAGFGSGAKNAFKAASGLIKDVGENTARNVIGIGNKVLPGMGSDIGTGGVLEGVKGGLAPDTTIPIQAPDAQYQDHSFQN